MSTPSTPAVAARWSPESRTAVDADTRSSTALSASRYSTDLTGSPYRQRFGGGDCALRRHLRREVKEDQGRLGRGVGCSISAVARFRKPRPGEASLAVRKGSHYRAKHRAACTCARRHARFVLSPQRQPGAHVRDSTHAQPPATARLVRALISASDRHSALGEPALTHSLELVGSFERRRERRQAKRNRCCRFNCQVVVSS